MSYIKKETYQKALKIIRDYEKQEKSRRFKNYVIEEMFNDVLKLVKGGMSVYMANKTRHNNNQEFYESLTSEQKKILRESNPNSKKRKGYISTIGFENIFNSVINGTSVKETCKKNGISVASFYNHLSKEQKMKLKLKRIK